MEPVVKVGVISAKAVDFVLGEGYACFGKTAIAENTVSFEAGKIRWNGQLYDELLFETANDDASFVLKNVTIGINFHWERQEDQRFQGALKFIVENDVVTAINILSVEDYLTSVISSEMSATASLELLKAHAVISRSWLLAQIEKASKKTQKGLAPSNSPEEIGRASCRERV